MPEFIKEAPFTGQYLANQRAATQSRLADAQLDRSDFALSEARRQSGEQQAVDQAYRSAVTDSFQPPAAPMPAAAPPPPVRQPVSAPQVPPNFDEQAFRAGITQTPWHQEYQQRYGEAPNLDDPNYNYRAAWAAGARPDVRDPGDGQYHWPSEFKGPNHPNRYVDGVDTITGQPQQQPAAAPQRPTASAAPPQSVSPGGLAAQRLAAVPGGGKAAMDLVAADRKAKLDQEHEVLRLASNPATVAQAAYLAQKNGINLPPDVLRNPLFAQATATAKDLYDDVGQARKFVQAFMRAPQGSDLEAAVAAGVSEAGNPQRTKWSTPANTGTSLIWFDLANPAHRVELPFSQKPTFQIADDGTGYAVDTQGRTAAPITTADGQTPKFTKFRPPAGAAGGAPAAMLDPITGTLYPAGTEAGPNGEVLVPAGEKLIQQLQKNVGSAAVATTNAGARTGAAQIGADGRVAVAGENNQTRRDIATDTNQTRRDVATTQATSRVDAAQARARTGTQGGALNFIAEKLQEEARTQGRTLTYQEALNMARARDRTPDTLRSLENMALSAAKADSRYSMPGQAEKVLKEWRGFYGLKDAPGAALTRPAGPAAPVAPAAAAAPAATPDFKYGPPGTKIRQNGVEYTVGADGIPQ